MMDEDYALVIDENCDLYASEKFKSTENEELEMSDVSETELKRVSTEVFDLDKYIDETNPDTELGSNGIIIDNASVFNKEEAKLRLSDSKLNNWIKAKTDNETSKHCAKQKLTKGKKIKTIKNNIVVDKEISKNSPVSCLECDYTGSKISLLKRHMLSHLAVKKFCCTKCSFTTNFYSYLKEHTVIHSAERPFKCSFCTFASKLKSNRKKHERTHQRFKCPECKFVTKGVDINSCCRCGQIRKMPKIPEPSRNKREKAKSKKKSKGGKNRKEKEIRTLKGDEDNEKERESKIEKRKTLIIKKVENQKEKLESNESIKRKSRSGKSKELVRIENEELISKGEIDALGNEKKKKVKHEKNGKEKNYKIAEFNERKSSLRSRTKNLKKNSSTNEIDSFKDPEIVDSDKNGAHKINNRKSHLTKLCEENSVLSENTKSLSISNQVNRINMKMDSNSTSQNLSEVQTPTYIDNTLINLRLTSDHVSDKSYLDNNLEGNSTIFDNRKCLKLENERILTSEMKDSIESANDEFVCTICNMVFRLGNTLRLHMEDKHNCIDINAVSNEKYRLIKLINRKKNTLKGSKSLIVSQINKKKFFS